MEKNYKVDQPVVVSDTQCKIHPGKITKVSRIRCLITTDDGRFRDDPFNMETGRIATKGYDYGHGCGFCTAEEHAATQRRDRLVIDLREHGIDLNRRKIIPNDQLEAILAVLKDGDDHGNSSAPVKE